MPSRRRATLLTLATLYRTLSARTRTTALLSVGLLAIAKLLGVLIAVRVAASDVQGAVLGGAFAVGSYALLRVVTASVRVNAETDLQRSMARAMLQGDVLDSHSPPMRALFEPMYQARAVVADVAPEATASALAALAVTPIVAAALPARVLVVAAAALAAVVVAQLLVSKKSAAVQLNVLGAYETMQDRASFVVEARLEIVARGAEKTALRSLDEAIALYRATARRATWSSAFLGRAPLAAGLAAVMLAVVGDASYRADITSAVLGEALVLAACLPILLGLVLRTNELVRTATKLAPLLDVIEAPRRDELARNGSAAPPLPASIVVRELEFAYSGTSPLTLRGLSFEWPAGEALFIEGPNGSGKSTLLRLFLGLRAPRRGTIKLGDRDLSGLDLPALRARIAYLPQRAYLGESHVSVRDALCALGGAQPDAALEAALTRVGLGEQTSADVLGATVGELSAGQRQRVALARVLLEEAAIYLLDEPDANLDRAGIRLVGTIVRDLVERGCMVAIAAHTEELASAPGTRLVLKATRADR